LTDERIEDPRARVYHDIGRNIVNYQKVERLMKAFLKASGHEGYLSDIYARQQKKNESIDRNSMGQLVKEMRESVFTTVEPNDGPAEVEEPWFRFVSTFEMNDATAKTWAEQLAELVRQRNDLVHHVLADKDFESVEVCERFLLELDRQNDHTKLVWSQLMKYFKHTADARKELGKFLQSEEGRAWFAGLISN